MGMPTIIYSIYNISSCSDLQIRNKIADKCYRMIRGIKPEHYPMPCNHMRIQFRPIKDILSYIQFIISLHQCPAGGNAETCFHLGVTFERSYW